MVAQRTRARAGAKKVQVLDARLQTTLHHRFFYSIIVLFFFTPFNSLFCHHETSIMAADIGHISQLLDATLDPSQHRKGTVLAIPLPRDSGC